MKLRRKPTAERRVAIILANYPNRDGRIGNGVGLDTPAGVVESLKAMKAAGYAIENIPESSADLIARLLDGPTNARARNGEFALSRGDYQSYVQIPDGIAQRWGAAETDPHCVDGAFRLPLLQLGNVFVGIQPARGYNIDPVKSYHDPELVPPHNYLAFYRYLRKIAQIDAASTAIWNGCRARRWR